MSRASLKDTASPTLDIPAQQLPKHIAMIMDGNGRWAQRNNLPRIEGHRRGTKTVGNVIEECQRLGIGQLTLYCLSSENWKRPQPEIDFLMHLLQQFMIESRGRLIEKKIRLEIIGRRSKLPDHVRTEMDKSLEMTSHFKDFCLCLAINYGARQEIVDAVQRIAGKAAAGQLDPSAIDEQTISAHLDTAGMPDPDLLIRTAGEMRVSNYLLWQISYAELWVTDRCWPEFRIEDLHHALRDYAARERRYGGLVDETDAEDHSC